MVQFEFEFLSPASAKISAPSAWNICLVFSPAEDAKGDAEFGEKLFELDAISK